MANTVQRTAEEAISSATEKAREVAASATGQARDLASTATRKAEDATTALGGGVRSMADTIRERGPHSGMLGTASSRVADSLESAGSYLQEEGLRGIGRDLTDLIRRNPLPAMLVGIGIGFLLARLTTRR